MFNTKKILAALIAFQVLTLTAFSYDCCDICENRCEICEQELVNKFNYVDIGVGPLPIPFPYFGIGHRTQKECHGKDFSLQVASVGCLTQVKTSALYLHYFHPNLCSQFYVGGGVSVSGLFSHRRADVLASPEFVFGKQYTNCLGDTRFFQMQASFPTISTHGPLYMPLVVFSYGIGF